MTTPPVLLNSDDYEDEARARLSPGAYGYFAGGSEDEITLRDNRAAWERMALLPRVLVDVSRRNLTTTVMGSPVAMPVLLAPCAMNALAHPDGELAVARAASATGVLQVLSTGSSRSIEEVAAVSTGPRWFQLYCIRDPEVSLSLVRRAEASGYSAIVLTVDMAVLGTRERDLRTGFELPDGITWKNLEAADAQALAPRVHGSPASADETWYQALDWNFLEELCRFTALPVLVKGVLSPLDARLAVEHGARGIVVSNHGGRQLDGAISTARALPAVAEAVAGRAEVYVDGGIRRGSHVLKALALGARAALVGRPYLWALAAGGESGVGDWLERIRGEFDAAMALSGLTDTSQISASLLAPESRPRT